MDPDAELDLLLGPVAAAEGADGVQQRQRHAGDLPRVELPVPHGQPRHHHVGVADGLHLGAPAAAWVSVGQHALACSRLTYLRAAAGSIGCVVYLNEVKVNNFSVVLFTLNNLSVFSLCCLVYLDNVKVNNLSVVLFTLNNLSVVSLCCLVYFDNVKVNNFSVVLFTLNNLSVFSLCCLVYLDNVKVNNLSVVLFTVTTSK